MSGIAGLFRLDGRPVGSDEIQRMRTRLAHRGPDGGGQWYSGCAGLVHLALNTTPESEREKLPFVAREGTLVVTADLRIDNREELGEAFGIRGADLATTGDGELVLHAYTRWGDRCPEHLEGDFAFALWDGERRRLFCARDHFGVKPFLYFASPKLFAFASEMKALFPLPEVPLDIDEVKVGEYLAGLFEDAENTFYKHILRLPPAHCATVTADHGVLLRRYWSLDPSREIRLGSDHEYAEAFRERFTEAVRCRLRSNKPVGSLLSGGLDSSAIVCVARNLLRERGHAPLKTFSAIFDAVPECDEREFIHAVLDEGDVESHFVHGDQCGPLDDLEHVLLQQDEPHPAPNLFLHQALYRGASNAGVSVLLDGIDGDTTMSHGIPRLAELARSGRWFSFVAEARGIARNMETPWSRIGLNRGIRPIVPGILARLASQMRGSLRRDIPSFLSADFASRIGLPSKIDAAKQSRRRAARSVRTEQAEKLGWPLLPLVLEVADRAAQPSGIEPRYPFFDTDLVKFCLALPSDQKLRYGRTRLVLRHALEGIAPSVVHQRPSKSNLSQNFSRSLRIVGNGELKQLYQKARSHLKDLVNPEAWNDTWVYLNREATHPEEVAFWRALILGTWIPHAGRSRDSTRAE